MYWIEVSSCIRFVAHNPINGPNYVLIQKDFSSDGCGEAAQGCRNIGEQILMLSSSCIDSALHELLHTIGFNHHHSRSDRDKYIAIHRANANCTDEDFEINFTKDIEFDERIKYLTPFDYESVMLYGEYTFSFGQPVMSSIREGVKINPSVGMLTKYDRFLINRFYNCETVDQKKSVIFYETESELSLVINYHEVERAHAGVKVELGGEKDFVGNKIVDDHEKAVGQDVNENEKDNLVIDDIEIVNHNFSKKIQRNWEIFLH